MHEEDQYLDLLEKIIDEGVDSNDRTGVGTKSLFGAQMRFSLRDSFPLFTTRRISLRIAFEELVWMMRGETDAKILQDKNIHIWDGNTTREFLDKRGLPYMNEGQIGKLYGFQMRNWGGDWTSHLKGVRTGIDQLQGVIDLLQKNPTSRRIIMNYWNVEDLNKGVLTPCHSFVQFRVNQSTNELDCMMTQRSCDMCCGVPINIAFYSLMTLMLASLCNFKPGEFIWSGGDVHVYKTHIDNVKKQIMRTPMPFPIVSVPKFNSLDDMLKCEFEGVKLENYTPHYPIKYEMAV
jgi:thymidylate synthase